MDLLLDYYKTSPNGSLLLFVDISLLACNGFHAFFVFSINTNADAPFKKLLTKAHYNVVTFFNNLPLFLTLMACKLIATICYLSMLYRDGHYCDSEILIRIIIAFYTLASICVFRTISYRLIQLGPDRTLEYEQELGRIDMINFTPPSKMLANSIVAPLQAILRTDVSGIDNISTTEPALYVMNHSLHGIEMSLFLNSVYQQKDVYLRGLADHFHFAMPHGEFLRKLGAVNGTRENVMALMEHKQNILVYPGGGQEVLKPSTVPKYTLMWKERLGFARLAIRYGYPIQPCACVGTEDMLDIMVDIPVTFIRKGQYVPVTYPVSPHRLQKVYFWFGEPIPTKHYGGDWKNDTYAREVRDKAKSAIEAAIRELQEKQSKDPNRFLMKKFANQVRSAQKLALGVFEDALHEASKGDDSRAKEEEGVEKSASHGKENENKNHENNYVNEQENLPPSGDKNQ